MSNGDVDVRGGTLLLVTVALATEVTAMQSRLRVPSVLVSAARGRPIEFAMLLADASVTVGLEVDSTDRYPRKAPDWSSVTGTTLVPIDAVMGAFNESHAESRAALIDGVLVIRPITRRAVYLDQPLTVDDLVVTGAIAALRRIFAGLDPRLDSGGGIVGSSFVSPVEAGDHITITFTPGATVLRALNELATQTGKGWVVVTAVRRAPEPPQIVNVGLLHRGGASSHVPIPDVP